MCDMKGTQCTPTIPQSSDEAYHVAVPEAGFEPNVISDAADERSWYIPLKRMSYQRVGQKRQFRGRGSTCDGDSS